MRDSIRPMLNRYAALSGREQLLVLIAIVAIAYQIADFVVFERQYRQIELLNRQIANDNRAMTALNSELNALATSMQQDPNSMLRVRIESQREQAVALQRRLEEQAAKMISPRDMSRFLEELLIQEPALTMLSMRTIDAEPLIEPGPDADRSATDAVLHRHGFELVFSGGYLATLRYLRALETLPWRFFWDSISYDVIEYPTSRVRLRLHTLSLSKDWIGV